VARRKKQQATEETGFGEHSSGPRQRLTPIDIQQKVFRLAFRGYSERDVDEFLDHVTEDLAALHEENKRLREGLGGSSGEDLEAARGQAEAIVREAREHAARLIEDAGGQPAATGGGLSSSFLLRERDFLQKLAHSVQDHARWLKEEAQRQRTSAGAPPTATASAKPSKSSGSAKKAGGSGPAGKGTSAGEATAAWGPPQQGMGEPSGGMTREQAPGEADPLLAAWESAFTAEGPEAKTSKEGEPSLRELFWGEE
jgi:DivIVA domain-containing protein